MKATAGKIEAALAREAGCRPEQAAAAVELLDGGATVPFIARYRKEATGGLDDGQLRLLAERLAYHRELEARREAVFKSVVEQGKMTDVLAASIAAAATKAELEDIYLPFRPRRRTKAEIARERGLEPLARLLMERQLDDPEKAAAAFLGDEVPDAKAALEGARDILSEEFAENPKTAGRVREHMRRVGKLRAKVVAGKEQEGAKYADYFDRTEDWSKAPSHRVLAMLRARNEGIISLDLEVDAEDPSPLKPAERMVVDDNGIDLRSAWLVGVAKWTWRVKLHTRLSIDLMSEIRERAEAEAIEVFARNLKDLLLAAPAGPRPTIGLDPGIRTGVKVAVVDATGKLVDTATVYPFQPRNDVAGAMNVLRNLVRKHKAELIAIGNGTASRETDRLVSELLKDMEGPRPIKVVVSEAGASVYSASALAAAEMPGVDVSLRGAVSIARRLQDPLAELVKIPPQAVGVGMYQHDVDEHRLARALDAVVEDAVNAVGVDLNTASPALLARVSGLGTSLAEAIVAYRNANGAFRSRRQLLEVSRLGPRAFEQCAGFLRIRDGEEPLDASAVHPEAYPVAQRIVKACGRDIRSLMGDTAAIRKLDPKAFVDDRFGLPTVKDILGELEKPGRDPRPAFKTAEFADGVNEITDLKPGMRLEGTVTNVAAFGAFVDIGVHQDGLVHVSELADRRVNSPSDVVKAGDVVRVTVIGVDVPRKRIALSMRKDAASRIGGAPSSPQHTGQAKNAPSGKQSHSGGRGALGDALLAALGKR